MTGQNKVFSATGAVAIASSLTPPTTTAIEIICVKLNLILVQRRR
jgi:hypothetical protein